MIRGFALLAHSPQPSGESLWTLHYNILKLQENLSFQQS
jgi:hypothetical protein